MTLELTLDDTVARIRLDDGKANALNGPMFTALSDALGQAKRAGLAVVIEGRAGFFSAGLDLKSLPGLPSDDLRLVLSQFAEVMLELFLFPRPVVAACTGHALAGGCVMLLGCDERYAAQGSFRLGLNETAVGLILPAFIVEIARLALQGPALKTVIVEGRIFDPASAERIGLVDEVLALESVVERAVERARILASLPASAYAGNKLGLRKAAARTGQAAFKDELDAFIAAIAASKPKSAQAS